MKYMLVMERRPKDYMPYDYSIMPEYNGADLTTLEGIDAFTSQFNDENELKSALLAANFIDDNELDKKMKIIFKENEGIRENKYGVCYKNRSNLINSQFLISFLEYCLKEPQIANRIYNEFAHQKELSEVFCLVLNVMKNVKMADNPKNIYYVRYMPYNEIRALALFIINNFSGIISYEDRVKAGEEHERKRIPIQYSA